eukprot:8854212-Pyramimonas_sp.AAC.1
MLTVCMLRDPRRLAREVGLREHRHRWPKKSSTQCGSGASVPRLAMFLSRYAAASSRKPASLSNWASNSGQGRLAPW